MRAKQVAWRISSGALKSYQKIMAKDDDEAGDAAVAGDGEKKALEDAPSNLVMPTPEQVLEEMF